MRYCTCLSPTTMTSPKALLHHLVHHLTSTRFYADFRWGVQRHLLHAVLYLTTSHQKITCLARIFGGNDLKLLVITKLSMCRIVQLRCCRCERACYADTQLAAACRKLSSRFVPYVLAATTSVLPTTSPKVQVERTA